MIYFNVIVKLSNCLDSLLVIYCQFIVQAGILAHWEDINEKHSIIFYGKIQFNSIAELVERIPPLREVVSSIPGRVKWFTKLILVNS